MTILWRSLGKLYSRLSLCEVSLRKCYAVDAKPTSATATLVPSGGDKTAAKKKKALAKKDDIPRFENGMPAILMGLMKPDDPMVQQGYGVGKTSIRLDWWNNNRRWHFWANWLMLKDVNRRKLVVEHAPYRSRMAALMDNNILPVAFRESVEEELKKLPNNCKWEWTRSFCQITGRRRGNILRYRCSRIVFRDLADHGKLAGVQRANF